MKKYLVISLALFGLTGCDPTAKDDTYSWKLPKGLEDCTIYKLRDTKANGMNVMRCPLSQTTSNIGGKSPQHVTLIEEPLNQKEHLEYLRLKEKYDVPVSNL